MPYVKLERNGKEGKKGEKMDKNLEDILPVYKNAVKEFPELEEKEIKLAYDPDIICIGTILCGKSEFSLAIKYCVAFLLRKNKIKVDSGLMVLGPDFFDLPTDEQEVVMMHELQHYIRMKKKLSRSYIKQIASWSEQLKGYEPMKHSRSRLIDWCVADEFNADNAVVEKGRGKALLKSLRKMLDNPKADASMIERRIANAEEKLGVSKTRYYSG